MVVAEMAMAEGEIAEDPTTGPEAGRALLGGTISIVGGGVGRGRSRETAHPSATTDPETAMTDVPEAETVGSAETETEMPAGGAGWIGMVVWEHVVTSAEETADLEIDADLVTSDE